ncbi:MAG: hypothetical protein OEZ08_01895 [Betaproteobacteria bacterium]|nr:hypothetical protein [Betaproteobacteria bacterium]
MRRLLYLAVLVVVLGLAGCPYVSTDGVWHSTLNYLTRRPGPALIGGGLLVVGTGLLLMIINLHGRRGLAWMLLVRIPWSLLGFILVVVGLPLIGLGVWELIEPLAFDRFIGDLQQRFDWRALERWWRGLTGPRR